jgi:hypothetical protein
MLVVQSNNQGVPFVLANPDATISRELTRAARSLIEAPQPVGARR